MDVEILNIDRRLGGGKELGLHKRDVYWQDEGTVSGLTLYEPEILDVRKDIDPMTVLTPQPIS